MERIRLDRKSIRIQLVTAFVFTSIITESGELVFYDQLTASTTQTSWLDSIALSQTQLYEEISGDNKTHLFSTGEEVIFGSNSCYLFHIGHRIIDYRNVRKKCGIVMVSIDVKLLEEVCGVPTENGLNFIVDGSGYLVACSDSKEVGRPVAAQCTSEEEKAVAYEHTARETGIFGDRALSVYSVYDEKTDWEIVRVTDQDELVSELHARQKMLGFLILLSLLAVLLIIVSQVTRMTGSIKRVVETMRKAGRGDLTVHVAPDDTRPTEIEIIAGEFNSMMDKLKRSIEKQKNAEITALEAQINPHFLYNTLDTINWIAIDKDEYEISNMITTLARILRYGISDSNGIVKIRDEVDWLRQYIFLQQTKLKNAFECRIDVEPELMNLPIHKLLLQPFIENAILHGFEGVDRVCRLQMSMRRDLDFIKIEIEDDGCGISPEKVEEMNHGIFERTDDKNHIGMENAITRLHMYYGENVKIVIESCEGRGTTVRIRIPIGGECS